MEISLKEARIPYERCEVDFFTKPEWYLKNVNPAGKVNFVFSLWRRAEGLMTDLRFQ